MARRASNVAIFVLLALVAAATILAMAAEPIPYARLGLSVQWRHPPGKGPEPIIASVEPGSPAAGAGLRAGDRIADFLSFDDRVALLVAEPNDWLPAGRPVTFTVARGATLSGVRLQGTERHRGPLWFIELRLFVYLLGVFVAGALVVFRPSVVTWSFALFVTFYLWPNWWYWQYFSVYGSQRALLAIVIASYGVITVGSLGLITFATRFPKRAALPRFYRTVEYLAIAYLAIVGAAMMHYQYAQLYESPALGYDALANAQTFVPAIIAIVLLGWTLLRSKGDERVRLVWAVAGPSLCTLFSVADVWLLSITTLPVEYSTIAGFLSSIAPFTMMYAVLRYRVIDIGFALNRSFAQAVVASDHSVREPREARRVLVRRAASLLSADIPLDELYAELAALLASFVDARSVLIATRGETGARLAYAYEDGLGGRPDDVAIPSESVTARVLRDGEPQLMRQASEWPAQSGIVSVAGRATMDSESAIYVPIPFGGDVIGVLSVQSLEPGAYDDEDLALLEACAIYLGARMHGVEQPVASERSALDHAVKRAWQRAAEAESYAGVMIVDVDLFSIFNETYGRAAGDTCLRQVGQALASALPVEGCFFVRFGGDQFAAAFFGIDASRAADYARAAGEAVRALGIPHQGSTLGVVTVTAGAVAARPRGDDWHAAIGQAQAQLAEAKQRRDAQAQIVARHNLPAQHSTFVGRAQEIGQIEAAFEASRIVTIAGPGGAGKTRVALEVARRALNHYPDGVWFVDLAGIKRGEFVIAAVAAAIGFDAPEIDLPRLVDVLSEKKLLLVLDNCEHLIDASARFASAVARVAAGVRILATSREPFSIPEESVFRLPAMGSEDAVALFGERTNRAVTAEDRVAVERIAEKLDGLPMAIEIAAARASTVTPAELLAHFGESLSDGSLRALFDWSYRLLTSIEQLVLRRLSVFSNGWTAEAAEALCLSSDLTPSRIGAAIDSLVAKSLVLREQRGDSVRFRFLETTRQYAFQALERHGEHREAMLRYLQWATAYAWDTSRRKSELPFAQWRALQTAELENYRSALHQAFSEFSDDAAAATIFRSLTGLLAESPTFAEFGDALDGRVRSGTLSDPQRAAFWLALGELLGLRRAADSLDAVRQAAELFRRCGDAYGEAYAVLLLTDAEQRRTETALAVARRTGDRHLAAGLLRNLARANADQGRTEQARTALRAAAEMVDRSDTVMVTEIMADSAGEELRGGNADGAIALWNQAASLAEEARPSFAALCYLNIGKVEESRGNVEAARTMLARSFALRPELEPAAV